jgi:hypothetical protein
MFGGLRSGRQVVAPTDTHAPLPKSRWEEGEVHADLVRDANGNFVWRYCMLSTSVEL